MALPITSILLICGIGYIFGQYADETNGSGSSSSRKLLQFSGTRRIKSQISRLTGPVTQTTIINQKFRRPVHRPRLASEPVPELPVFTAGIRGSRPASASTTAHLEQNDETLGLLFHTIQTKGQHEVKPVNEENEKDQDIVQVIANLGAVSGNLITPTTISSIASSVANISYLQQQQKLQKSVQYKPIQQVSKSSLNIVPETQVLHQVIAAVQYKPEKPVRLHKQHQEQLQLVDHNEYDINEARLIKQRAQVAPKKLKPDDDYYEGRTKKPVAQVIRRYREETADGSIIWGFENDDGSFKEEIIGIDCITRGKYGYVDPDGLRREYTYETGIKCDEDAQQQQDQDILNTFVDYQENKLVLPSGKTIDLSSMGKKQARRPQIYRN